MQDWSKLFEVATPQNENSQNLANLLSYVSSTDVETAERKLNASAMDLVKMQRGALDMNREVYFRLINGKGVCSLKYNAQGTHVHEKKADGLHLRNIEPYFELADICAHPNNRGGLSKLIYGFLVDQLSQVSHNKSGLLIGAVGMLQDVYDNLYQTTSYTKSSTFVPRDLLNDEQWAQIGVVRPVTTSTQVYAQRLNLDVIGSSKTHAGPIFYTSKCADAISAFANYQLKNGL